MALKHEGFTDVVLLGMGGSSLAPEVLHAVIDRAIQVHGALGLTDETPLAAMYLVARSMRLVDGPDEVHRMVVSREVLRAYRAGRRWEFM